MKLLIITQKVDMNDPVLGFFYRWIDEFSKHCESVTVITLGVGKYDLPDNVKVFSLGKEKNVSRLSYLVNFYRIIWRERKNYDKVFVHMNQIYVILGGIFWRLARKSVGLWYVHREKTVSLWVAEKLTNFIFTSAPESFLTSTRKALYLGHGIDIKRIAQAQKNTKARKESALISAGRLTPIKDQKTIILACAILAHDGADFTCTFIGDVGTKSDEEYKSELVCLVKNEKLEKNIFFVQGLPHDKLLPFFWESGVHINGSPTGGLDKVVIESMATGAIPLVANEAFCDTFGRYADRLIFHHGNPEDLARHLKDLLAANDKEEIRNDLGKGAREKFDLPVLVKKIITRYETSR